MRKIAWPASTGMRGSPNAPQPLQLAREFRGGAAYPPRRLFHRAENGRANSQGTPSRQIDSASGLASALGGLPKQPAPRSTAAPAAGALGQTRRPPTPDCSGKSPKKPARKRRHEPVRRTGAPGIKTRREKIGGDGLN